MDNHNHKREKEEFLERLWYMKSENKDSMDDLKSAMAEKYDTGIVDILLSEDLVKINKEYTKIVLLKKGEEYARQIIRAHRIAERLIYDVLGDEFESGACEFEHIITTELVDSICILLGHPRECPHGLPIPEGECCKVSARLIENSVIPLVELEEGKSVRVAYVSSQSDPQLHKLDSLQIRPGVHITLHQIYPSFVIKCEGVYIALDKEIVSKIFVWKKPSNVLVQTVEMSGRY